MGRDAWFGREFMLPLGCVSGSVAGEFPWELSEFPSVPHFRRGWRWIAVATSEFHSGRRAFRSYRSAASESETGCPTGALRRLRVQGRGNCHQCCAASTAKGLQGRSALRAPLHSRPSRSPGNLLLEKWAGGGDDDGGPSLASAGA